MDLNLQTWDSGGRKPDVTHHVNEPRPTKLVERISAWGNSLEGFGARIVHGTQFVVVECLCYPYTVFSRQCQAFPYSQAAFSLTAPLSSALVLHNMAHNQGVGALWRGWYSHLSLLIARPFIEAAILKLTNSRASEDSSRVKALLSYLAVKSVACIATIPLVSFTILEMVQNTAQKAYRGGLLEVAAERQLLKVGGTHRLPYLSLILPTMLHILAIDHLSGAISQLINRVAPSSHQTEPPYPFQAVLRSLWVAYVSSALSDVLLYPLQTVVVRLHCQGMPVLMDNVENGSELAFVQTYYRGFLDCISGIFDSEGLCGFYKGFSSLLIRYAVHGVILLGLWRTFKFLHNRQTRASQ